MKDDLIKEVMTLIKCSLCGHHYEADNITVLEHQEGLWFLRAFCSDCRTYCLVAAVVKGDRTPKVVTDLTQSELGRFKKAGKLEANEVLDMHNFLKDFDGDFAQLFKV